MIDTVIFDIGRVLVGFEWEPFLKRYFDDERAAVISNAFMGDNRWNELDRGIRTLDEIIDSFKEHAVGFEDDIDFVMEHAGESLSRMDYAIPWIEELKAMGKKVYYLSNYSSFLRYKREDVLDFIPYLDGGVFSYEVKAIKPDKKIYEELLAKFSIDPRMALFIDDNEANVSAAIALGIDAYKFTSYECDHDDIMKRVEDVK